MKRTGRVGVRPTKIDRVVFATQLDKIIGRLAGGENPPPAAIESAKKLHKIRNQAVGNGSR